MICLRRRVIWHAEVRGANEAMTFKPGASGNLAGLSISAAYEEALMPRSIIVSGLYFQ
jgi:hypothetical protein